MFLLLKEHHKLYLSRERHARSMLPTLAYLPIRAFMFLAEFVKGVVIENIRSILLALVSVSIALLFRQSVALGDIFNHFENIFSIIVFSIVMLGILAKSTVTAIGATRERRRTTYSRDIHD